MFEQMIDGLEKQLAALKASVPNKQNGSQGNSEVETLEQDWQLTPIEFRVPSCYWDCTIWRNVEAACLDVAAVLDKCLGGDDRLIGSMITPGLSWDGWAAKSYLETAPSLAEVRRNSIDSIAIVAFVSHIAFSEADVKLLRAFRKLGHNERVDTVAAFFRHPRLTISEDLLRSLQEAWADVVGAHRPIDSVGTFGTGLTINSVRDKVLPAYQERARIEIERGTFDYDKHGWFWSAVDGLDVVSADTTAASLTNIAQELEGKLSLPSIFEHGFFSESNQFLEPVISMLYGEDSAALQSRSNDAYTKLREILEERERARAMASAPAPEADSARRSTKETPRGKKSKAANRKRPVGASSK